MDENRFLDYVADVYYYCMDKRWTELRNILFLFTNECNSKSGMLLFYLAKHGDLEYLIEYMDTLRRGQEIDLVEVQDDYINALIAGDLDFAKYLKGFMNSRGKGTHQEIFMPYIDFAYDYTEYKTNGKRYSSLDDDLDIEDELYDELRNKYVIKDIVSKNRFTSLKQSFMMKMFNNIDTFECTDRKGQHHIYAKVDEEIEDIDVEELQSKIAHALYLGNVNGAKEYIKYALLHTKGFNPDMVRLYNKLYKDVRINRLERRICEEEVKDDSYNILYSYNYNIPGIDEIVNEALKGHNININSYTDEEKGLILGIISREAYKSYKSNLGDKYFRLACNYYKKNPEVNYFLNYIEDNKGSFGYQVVRSLPDAVRLELKK